MANDEHLALLKKGVEAWNAWRRENAHIRPDLSKADFNGANLSGADLSGADLSKAILLEANLSKANLFGAILNRANLSWAYLIQANLIQAKLSGADLSGADLSKAILLEANLSKANLFGAILDRAKLSANLTGAKLSHAKLTGAKLSGAVLIQAKLSHADLSGAKLSGAVLSGADLTRANLSGAKLIDAKLNTAIMVGTDLTGGHLVGCSIHGVSAWGLKLDETTTQQDLVITQEDEPAITVDNIEVAQFIYLMLNNQKVRDVIDTITSKVVLILGRFTAERKAVLDALREELRKRNYLPVLFDFEVPARRNITETITLLARMARFIIADLTDPSSIPQELQAIIPSVRVPVQPLLLEGSSLYSMFKDFDPQDFHWVLPVYRYKKPEQLLATLAENVIAPAEGKLRALQDRRRMIEAELTKPR
jgi:uncharacterized protein YjbI with pentapeptide repeats